MNDRAHALQAPQDHLGFVFDNHAQANGFHCWPGSGLYSTGCLRHAIPRRWLAPNENCPARMPSMEVMIEDMDRLFTIRQTLSPIMSKIVTINVINASRIFRGIDHL